MCVDEAEALGDRVDHPGGAEEDAKGEGTQDLVDPERQDEQQDHGARKAALGDLRDVVGDGVAEREVEQGNEDRDDDGAQEDLEMEVVESVGRGRSEEHTTELQSLMRSSNAVF